MAAGSRGGARSARADPLQPVSRPARPLRRARDAGRPLGRARHEAERALELRPECRRPARGRPRPRALERHVLRRGGRLAGAPGAPARVRLEALPPLRPSLRVRGRLPRPPGPLPLPQLRPQAAGRSGGCHARQPARDEGRRGGAAHARGRDVAAAPPARPLQRLQRARRGGIRVRAGRAGRARARGTRARRRRLRARRDHPGRRAAGLDPAREEPGGRERGAANPHARGRRHRPVARAERQDRRRPRRELDLGRRLRGARGAGQARDLLRHARGGDGAASEVRGHLSRVDLRRARSRPLARHGGARGARTALLDLRELLAERGLAKRWSD